MAFDPTYPVTNSTPWNTLYQGLRNQFAAINEKFTPYPSWNDMSLVTNWSQGDTAKNCGYRKDPLGIVHLRGRAVANASAGTTIVSALPSGYYPTVKALTFSTAYYYNVLWYMTTITISTGGAITIGSVSNNAFSVFDAIKYYVGV